VATTLAVYCALIVLASLGGGWFTLWLPLNHRRLEILVSFVSGVMLGVALLHLLPHAWEQRVEAAHNGGSGHLGGLATPIVTWLLLGFLVMFFIERFFCFHHHDVDDGHHQHAPGDGDHHHGHAHDLTWTGAAVGLTLHSLVAGVALAAAVRSAGGPGVAWSAGLGTFLAIILHKPFDAMTIGALMTIGGHPTRRRHLVNGLFGLAVPAGAILFFLGADAVAHGSAVVSAALAFSAGTFLCISLSDLLPELQFHQHDRVKLSIALLLGIAVAWGAAQVEGGHEETRVPLSSLLDSANVPARTHGRAELDRGTIAVIPLTS